MLFFFCPFSFGEGSLVWIKILVGQNFGYAYSAHYNLSVVCYDLISWRVFVRNSVHNCSVPQSTPLTTKLTKKAVDLHLPMLEVSLAFLSEEVKISVLSFATWLNYPGLNLPNPSIFWLWDVTLHLHASNLNLFYKLYFDCLFLLKTSEYHTRGLILLQLILRFISTSASTQ